MAIAVAAAVFVLGSYQPPAFAAAISITPASVLGLEGDKEQRLAGGTITAGQVVRLSGSSVVAAVNDTANNAKAYGIALNGGASGQPIILQKTGDVTIGGTVAVGKIYALGTAGGIIPVDDIAGSEFITVIGVGISATAIRLSVMPGGVAAAGAVSDVSTPNDEALAALLRDAA